MYFLAPLGVTFPMLYVDAVYKGSPGVSEKGINFAFGSTFSSAARIRGKRISLIPLCAS